jgi:HSP20 family molecular chaperone IbpA
MWIRQEINPLAEKLLGRPILVFEESKLDPMTGAPCPFCWWLAGTPAPATAPGQPEAELFNEADRITIVVELLGVNEQAIRVSAQDDKVVIWTEDASLSYYQEIALPAAVDAGMPATHYVNGILSVSLNKVKGSAQ